MSRQELLRQIAAVNKKLLASLPPPPASLNDHFRPPAAQIPPLRLSKLTAHFRSELEQSALLPPALQLASERMAELSAFYQESYDSICKFLLTSPRSHAEMSLPVALHNLRSAFEKLYGQIDLPPFLHDALRAQTAHHKEEPPLRERKFNHAFTPCLEKYFEYNAYPSASDRLLLARKSMMTPRQIEVWFQNHRNRTKKDEKPFKRLGPNDSSLQFSLEALESRVPLFTMPGDKETTSFDDDIPDGDSTDEDHFAPQVTDESIDSLGAAAPSHAFPAKYPPNCVDDPFPTKNGVFTFPAVVWKRRPAEKSAHQDPAVNVDELTVIFASKLNLREVGKPRVGRTIHYQTDSRTPWFATTVTVLPPAPHPALVRRRTSGASTSSPTIPSSTIPRLQTRNVLSHSRPFSGTPPSLCLSDLPTHLPRRKPSKAGVVTNAGFTPTTQPSISSVRIPSFSSVGSRTSSWSSLAANDPITPPLSPTHDQGLVLTKETLGTFEECFKTSDDDTTSFIQQHYGFNSLFLPVANCMAT